jgi:hypothetical protein
VEGSPFAGFRHRKADEVHWTARIDEDQAAKIIGHLLADGFFDRARNVHGHRMEPTRFPAVVLQASGPDEVRLLKEMSPGGTTLKRLEGLRAVLDGDAAEAMDRLLAQLRAAPAASIYDHSGRAAPPGGAKTAAPHENSRAEATIPPEEISTFLDVVESEDFHDMRRKGEEIFQAGHCVPDHATRFGNFSVFEPQPGQLRYEFYSFKGEAGAGSILLFLDKATGKIISFSAVEASF